MLLQGNINAFRVQLQWVCKLIALLFERKVHKAVAQGHKKMLHRRGLFSRSATLLLFYLL